MSNSLTSCATNDTRYTQLPVLDKTPQNNDVIVFPEGGGRPRDDVGEYGDFMGTLQQISALVVGEMWGFLNALLSGRMWGLRFSSTVRRLGTINCSIDRWQDGGGTNLEQRTKIKKVNFFLNIHKNVNF